jgi:hypothetical protein
MLEQQDRYNKIAGTQSSGNSMTGKMSVRWGAGAQIGSRTPVLPLALLPSNIWEPETKTSGTNA